MVVPRTLLSFWAVTMKQSRMSPTGLAMIIMVLSITPVTSTHDDVPPDLPDESTRDLRDPASHASCVARHSNTLCVPQLEWDYSNRLFLHELYERRTPVILLNSPLSQWPCTTAWTPEYLTRAMSTLWLVQRQRQPRFRYAAPDKPIRPAPDVHDNTESLFSMPTGQFFDRIRTIDPAGKYYMSMHPLHRLPRVLQNDVKQGAFMTRDHSSESIHLWMGGRNTTTHLHYDAADNIFVQIHGHKRFQLFPFGSHLEHKMWPAMHAWDTQSQLDPDTRPGLDQGVFGYEVVLGPGQVLYVPAFMLHEVTSTDLCISLSVWMTGPESRARSILVPGDGPTTVLYAVLAHEVGVRRQRQSSSFDEADPDPLVSVLTTFLTQCDIEDVTEFLLSLATTRYSSPTLSSSPLLRNMSRPHDCDRGLGSRDGLEFDTVIRDVAATLSRLPVAVAHSILADITEYTIAYVTNDAASWMTSYIDTHAGTTRPRYNVTYYEALGPRMRQESPPVPGPRDRSISIPPWAYRCHDVQDSIHSDTSRSTVRDPYQDDDDELL